MVVARKPRSLRHQWLSRLMDFRLLSLLFALLVFTTTCLLVSKKFNAITRIKTVAGDNLKPTPWHGFPLKTFSSSSKYGRASQIFQCSYLSCASPLRLIRSSTSRDNLFQNSSGSCPAFFQWIHEDLAPWRRGGITEDHIRAAQEFAAFRVVIVDSRLYVDLYYACTQTRMMFTIWGLLLLLERYPGLVPDVDLMFECMDRPTIRRSQYDFGKKSPPPLFRYCSNKDHFDIPFPDWSYWGWAEVNLPPWEEEFYNIKQGSKDVKWIDRKPVAYWKGNPDVGAPIREKLFECNNSRTSGAEILRQNWIAEAGMGYEQSKLSKQCRHRYKLYVEGFAWSVSFKYILSCDSPVLVVSPEYYDFFTRGLMPKENYWPVRPRKLCPSIKFAVDWGNSHPTEAEAIGKQGQQFMQNLNMENVYDYMFHLLSEYSKLQKFKPQVPTTAQEVCKTSILCLADSNERMFLERSIPKTATKSLPCSLPSPNHDLTKQWIEKKNGIINQIEKMENVPQGKKMEKLPRAKKMEDVPQGKKMKHVSWT